MSAKTVTIRQERTADIAEIETITARIFGPGMKARAAYALREGVAHDDAFSFVAHLDDQLVGSVRLTPVTVGKVPVLMLGPLGVIPELKDKGVGKQLMQEAVRQAKIKAVDGGIPIIMLVGDYGYYHRFGFERADLNAIAMPRPVDPTRILLCALLPGAADGLAGVAEKWSDEVLPGV